MKAIIVGAGEVGYHMADRLSREGHEITLIEKDASREGYLKEKINAKVIVGSGASADVLEDAGIAKTDIFIAVTEVDEVNMVACLLARQYNVPTKIARVNSLEYTSADGKLNAEKLGIELMVNPKFVVSEEICEMIEYIEAVEAAEFAEGRVVFLGYRIHEDSPFVGKSLQELELSHGAARLVVTSIHHEDETVIPTGKTVIRAGDIVYFVCQKRDVNQIRHRFGFRVQEAKNIFILGAGNVGAMVAERLAGRNRQIKVIDRSYDHCRDMAEKLENVLVLCTDSTDVETLKNEGIASADVFIGVTDDDQSNILGSLLAKRSGAKRVITLVNKPQLKNLADSLGVDASISPRLSTASAILKFIRRGNVLSMVEQSHAEVLEIQLRELEGATSILGRPIHSIHLPKGVIIGAIVRENEVIIPSGEDELHADDRVIIFTLLKSVPKVEKFFS